MRTGDKSLDDLLAETETLVSTMRAELAEMRPQLVALQELYTTYIASIRQVLFVAMLRMPSGEYRNLPQKVERECEEAVVRVLETRLAKVNKALGQ